MFDFPGLGGKRALLQIPRLSPGSYLLYPVLLAIFLFSFSISGFGQAYIADFSVNETEICTFETVTFTDQSSGPNSRYLTGWSWDFGEGADPATSVEKGPHLVTYTTSGPKTVKLTVTFDNGQTATVTKTDLITVNPLPDVSLGFLYQRTITIDHNHVYGDEDLVDFPMLINIAQIMNSEQLAMRAIWRMTTAGT